LLLNNEIVILTNSLLQHYVNKHKSHVTKLTRHRASTSTHWHFTFGAMLSQQQNTCTDCKSTQ